MVFVESLLFLAFLVALVAWAFVGEMRARRVRMTPEGCAEWEEMQTW